MHPLYTYIGSLGIIGPIVFAIVRDPKRSGTDPGLLDAIAEYTCMASGLHTNSAYAYKKSYNLAVVHRTRAQHS